MKRFLRWHLRDWFILMITIGIMIRCIQYAVELSQERDPFPSLSGILEYGAPAIPGKSTELQQEPLP